jgi:hypothetical protein
LVSGDVNIAGDLMLDGEDWQVAPLRAEPGPGGYRGGVGYLSVSAPKGGGLGVGGGHNAGQGGNHATFGNNNTGYPTYGNLRVLPLVGGSGGGSYGSGAHGGAAGGGALLLATTGTLTIDGSISAEGGNGAVTYFSDARAGAGAGGAVRLIAESIGGGGAILAKGGPTVRGGDGRIRIEAWYSDATWTVSPAARVMPPDDPVLLWLPAGAPTVAVVSIASAPVPTDPRAHFEIGEEDVTLDLLSGDADIRLETHNVDTVDGIVEVRVTPEHGEFYPMIQAVFESGDYDTATWVATTELPTGYFTVQAHAVNPSP